MLFCLIYPEFRVQDPDGLFLKQNAFLHYILVHLDFDDRCLSTLVNIPELGVNCCKNHWPGLLFLQDYVWQCVTNCV